MKRTLPVVAALASLVLTTCTPTQSDGIWIQDVIWARPPTCLIESRSNYIKFRGLLDVVHPDADPAIAANAVPVSYYAALRILNNLIDNQRKPIYRLDDEGMDYMPNHFRVGILGYEACVAGPQDDDPYRRCEDIPDAINYFIPAGIGAIQNTPAVDSAPILPSDVLLQYFENDLTSIPSGGLVTLVVRVTALGQLENGDEVRSNMFHFPVDICRGCRNCTDVGVAVQASICSQYQDDVPECEAVSDGT